MTKIRERRCEICNVYAVLIRGLCPLCYPKYSKLRDRPEEVKKLIYNMKAIEIIKQNAKMWLGPKYSNKEYEIFKEGIEPFANRCIKEILEANNEEKKAPRTGFPKPTEKEKRDFGDLLESIKHTAPQSFFNCPKHKSTPLTRVRGKVRICSKCDIK